MKNLKKLIPKLIGKVGVDAGMIWIGDPCYIIHNKTERLKLGKEWQDFCNIFYDNVKKTGKSYKSFDYEHGIEGLGICTSTGHGDGSYNVIGFFKTEESKSPSCVMIDFDGVFEI